MLWIILYKECLYNCKRLENEMCIKLLNGSISSWQRCMKVVFGTTLHSALSLRLYFGACPRLRVWCNSTSGSADTCSCWFFTRRYFYPEDGGDTLLRNVGSHKIYTAPHPWRRYASSVIMEIGKFVYYHWPFSPFSFFKTHAQTAKNVM
jgi:hypothetical protein